MIRVSDEAKRLLGALWAPDGEVLRLIPRSSEADGLGGLVGGLAFRHGPYLSRHLAPITFDASGAFQDVRTRP